MSNKLNLNASSNKTVSLAILQADFLVVIVKVATATLHFVDFNLLSNLFITHCNKNATQNYLLCLQFFLIVLCFICSQVIKSSISCISKAIKICLNTLINCSQNICLVWWWTKQELNQLNWWRHIRKAFVATLQVSADKSALTTLPHYQILETKQTAQLRLGFGIKWNVLDSTQKEQTQTCKYV